ncbi:DUF6438 domain-containing protein [Paludisphaera soli]|uniref:DUF6438 domain-containing protein n=1 Tax=Paludisphaera soli TaxID=2712865 RepID=UPI0013ECD126|nr:DUF6438 domain-containing protein [Paludisphaera soli]
MQALLLLLCVIPLVSADDKITEILLSRSDEFQSGPVDKVVLRSDGTAAYTGTANVEDLGRFKGTFEDEDFKKLANLLVEKKFFEMNSGYFTGKTDQPSRFTQVTRAGQHK